MTLTRRSILQSGCLATAALITPSLATAWPRPTTNKISLATWSIVRSHRAGVWKLPDVARICREDFGIDGIEYVTSFFDSVNQGYLNTLNQQAADHGVENVLIMVDGEGPMVSYDKVERMQAAINHRKWVDMAAYLGCHAIRCNAYGGGATYEEDRDSIKRAAESFSALVEYAREFNINIVIENHGGLSSDPRWLPDLCKEMDSNHFGLLPDYGNYNLEQVNVYEAIDQAMPYAKGVSVKAGWQPDGGHPQYDVERLLKISVDSGYTGYWGIESGMRRGRNAPNDAEVVKKDDWDAVLWTKKAIDNVVFA